MFVAGTLETGMPTTRDEGLSACLLNASQNLCALPLEAAAKYAEDRNTPR